MSQGLSWLIAALIVWALTLVVAFLSPPGRLWWRQVRPVRGKILQSRRALKRAHRARAAIVKEAERLPERLKRQWFKHKEQAPVDALLEVSGVGDATLDLLRKRGIKRLDQVKTQKQLTHIKGLGPHKAKLLIRGRRQAELAWEERLQRQYRDEIYPKEHKAQVLEAQNQAAIANTQLKVIAQLDAFKLPVGLWRTRLLPSIFAPVDVTTFAPYLSSLDEALDALSLSRTSKPAKPAKSSSHELDARINRLEQRLGSRDALWIHTLREAYEPFEFEDFVAGLWRAMGYQVHVTPRSGDHGADVIVSKGAARIAIECKRYAASTSVGNDVVLRVVAHKSDLDNPATHAMVVTTGRYTPKAVEAALKFGVELVGPDELVTLMRKANFTPDLSKL